LGKRSNGEKGKYEEPTDSHLPKVFFLCMQTAFGWMRGVNEG
jgi:hypothetical protein